MKILTCCDSFKDTLDAIKVGEAIQKGLRSNAAWPSPLQMTNLPLSDGGEGFLKSIGNLVSSFKNSNWVVYSQKVTGPLPDMVVDAKYGVWNENTAIVEMAQAAGIEYLSKDQRNPLKTTTFGVGELLKHIANMHPAITKIIMGVGSSATNDGGMGALQALGLTVDMGDKPVPSKITGASLSSIQSLDLKSLDWMQHKFQLEIACDVETVFIGDKGATAIYGPQKGATTETMLNQLETGMVNLASLFKKHANVDITSTAGSGAAGGIAGSFMALLQATLERGVHILSSIANLPRHIASHDVIFTGEGCYDASTFEGKLVSHIQSLCQTHQKPLYVVCGVNRHPSPSSFVYALLDRFDEKTCFEATATSISSMCTTLPPPPS